MEAMLVLVCISILMMVTKMSDATSSEIITAHNGKVVLLTADLQEFGMKHIKDIRWTHPDLVISLLDNKTRCHHGRCELLSNGSLRFSRVQSEDSGNYKLQVFDEGGIRLKVKEFLLIVDTESGTGIKGTSSPIIITVAVVSVLVCCLPLMLIFFNVMRRRRQRTTTATSQLQGNIYVVMHGHRHSNLKEEKQEQEEETYYVSFNPAAPMDTSTQHKESTGVEDVYV